MSESGGAASRAETSPIVQAVLTQCRVIKALILRETISRYGEHKIGFLWALIEPMALVLGFVVFLTYSSAGTFDGMPVTLFMITGICAFFLFRNTMTQMQNAIAPNRSLLSFPQVTTFDVILARAILEVSVMLCVFMLLLFFARLYGEEIHVENPLGVMAALSLLIVLSIGIGYFLASISPIVPSVKQFATVVLGRPMFLTSGIFFTADSVPMPYRQWLLYNPVMHMIELTRSMFFREFESTHASWSYAFYWAIGALAFGLLVHQALQRRAIVGL